MDKIYSRIYLIFTVILTLICHQVAKTQTFREDRSEYDFSSYIHSPLRSDNSKNKVDTLGAVLKRHVHDLRQTENKQVDIIFLVDSSASVGPSNFKDEIKFVRKLLADFTVDSNHTRVSVITFSSRHKVKKQIDYIGIPDENKHKCSLMENDIPGIVYYGGGTYTLGAILEAKKILQSSRPDAKRAVFLITDGFSNGGDPRPEAQNLRESGVKMFTFGIRNGNVRELHDMASEPKNETCYILDSFEEFEALARRALHEDLHAGSFILQASLRCNGLCSEGTSCCDDKATCRCGTHSGLYQCLCQAGYYGTGLRGGCLPCPSGTYKPESRPGDESTCIPCPDENQVTSPGETSAAACQCKKGFRIFNETGCAALTCPVLAPPKSGYFVNDKCNNVFNAACGIRCRPGYELRGSSLRICQEDGTWSGKQTECIMKTCPSLPTPKNGNMICSRDDFAFSTVCRFTCDTGYKLVGSRKRECLAIAYWTGITTRCREITCQQLPEVRDGHVYPAMCTRGEVSFGTTCQVACYPGYSLVGPQRKQCTPEGMWAPSVNGKMSHCEDTTPPFIMCPLDVEEVADDDDSSAEITWQVPLAVDNSGLIPIFTIVPAVVPPKRFPIGTTLVKYIAEDLNKNKAKCSFKVKVLDKTPPTIDRCFSPLPVVSPEPYGNVTWDEPTFSDNSGKEVRVERTHAPGMFPRGKTTVKYTAIDGSGNNNTCVLEINVIPHPCEYPRRPIHGTRECHESKEGVHCSVSCNEGYGFAIKPAEEYFCAFDNVWRPEDKMPFPDCSVQTAPNGIIQPASLTYKGPVSCRQHILLNEIEATFEKKVSIRVNELCEDSITCDVEDMKTVCEEEEDFNTIRVVLSRKRRSLNDILMRNRRAPISTDNIFTNADGHNDSSVTFDFSLKGQVATSGNRNEDLRRQGALTDTLERILNTLKQEANRGIWDIQMSGKTIHFANITYDAQNPTLKCKPGLVLQDEACVNCPVGTHFNVISETCESCARGTYQPNEGMVSCLVCPANTSTHHHNSISNQECKAQCLPGTFSSDGLEPCMTCPMDQYQSLYGQTSCLTCPDEKATSRRGSRRLRQCKRKCEPGYVSKTGLQPCLACPKGFYQSDERQSSCYECPGGGTTVSIASTRLQDCEGDWEEMQADVGGDLFGQQQLEVNECFAEQCLHGGTCRQQDFSFVCDCAAGYKGLNCETEINECEANPCLHNGSCIDLVADYKCKCQPGFTSKKCEVNIDDCQPSPCMNGGLCIDQENGYRCACPEGYQGENCEEVENYCMTNPCLHNGTCQNALDGYSCICDTGYTGVNCEIDIDECSEGPCTNNATCEDGIGEYRCHCGTGYTGKKCEVDINECESSPCVSGATCEDQIGQYVCRCPPGFSGPFCETEVTSNFLLDFPSSSTLEYSKIPMNKDLTSLTAAFWMKSTDELNQGTPFSYSFSDDMDNAFTITDYSGFVIYVNNQKVSTDVNANDGDWHHITVTWSSNRGAWKIYKDGQLYDQGNNLAAGETIQGGGSLVVGQEQDPGGVYTPNEAFVGKISHLNIWDQELPLGDIDDMRLSCRKQIGNVIAWPDIQSGLHGDLQADSANFCRECPVPVQPTYGEVTYDGTTAGSTVTYQCSRGFNVAGRNRRQCLVTGEWEGRAPTCQRVECGYPGNINNGFVDGNRFSYDNRIRYSCYKGYKLVGDATRYCNENGQWEGTAPRCLEINCELPLLSENTLVTGTRKSVYSPGETVNFACTPGNRLFTEHDSVLCQTDGTWDKSVPTCDPQTCKSEPPLVNGGPLETLDEYSVGFILTYECDFGYKLSENSINPTGQIRCLPTGNWETNLPECVLISCSTPPTVANGVATYTSVTFLSTVQYTCDTGYRLFGETDLLECLEFGNWDPSPPECRPVDCGRPDEVLHGNVKADSYIYNSIATYQCDSGYFIIGNSQRRCQQNASWSDDIPVCKPVSCGRPDSIENGEYVGRDFTLGNTIRYRCQEGYVIVGVEERTCGENGDWSGQTPGCIKRECSLPVSIDHGFYSGGSFYYKDTVTYECDLGYRMNGSSQLQCQSNGEWSPLAPSCTPVECPLLGNITNGNIKISGRVFTSQVEYVCNQGYEMEGESIRICQPEGQWSGAEPTCNPSKCSPPIDITNGRVDYKDLILGSVVLYSCDEGFELDGEDVRRCLTTLEWSDDEPRCVPVSCPEPPNVSHGRKTVSGLVYQSTVIYECDTGYELQGTEQLQCTAQKVWSDNPPVCSPVRCESLSGIISNGRMFGSDFTYGSSVYYECDPGYNINGASNRTCLATGRWDATIPVCEIVHCPRQTLPNGSPSTFETEYGTNLTFTCRSGYVLFGSSVRLCQETGLWTGTDPVCVKCSKPPSIQFGVVTESDGTATYQCDVGYSIVGSQTTECQIDGSWIPEPPVCEPKRCTDLNNEHFPNGYILAEGSEVNSLAEYVCDEGYNLIGDPYRFCLSDGQWSGSKPLCLVVRCDGSFYIEHGQIFGGDFTYKSNITYVCQEGFELNGNSYRTCQADGQWSGTDPTCQIKQCPILRGISHGSLSGGGNTYGSRTIYTCDVGYSLKGNATRVCEATGQWSGNEPICEIVQCVDLDTTSFNNGQFTISSLNFQGLVEYTCNEGYKMIGESIRICQPDGQWSGIAPRCDIVRCVGSFQIQNGNIIVTDNTYNATLTYECIEGYELKGNKHRICQSNGHWGGTDPTCGIVECSTPVAIDNGQIIGRSYTYGSSITYTCDSGFQLTGNSNRVCQASGEWTGISASCVKIQCREQQNTTIVNGYIVTNGLELGNALEYFCDIGYEMIGESIRTCQPSGRWSGIAPICVIVRCSGTLEIQNGRIISTDNLYNSNITYVCNDGYRLIGKSYRTCESNGRWSGTDPICKIITCPSIVDLENGRVQGVLNTYGNAMTYSCNAGYELLGNPRRVCEATGNWSGEDPECVRIQCPRPKKLENGVTFGNTYTLGSQLRYRCNNGFMLDGPGFRLCLFSKMWSGPDPSCKRIQCPHPAAFINGLINGGDKNKHEFEDIIQYVCNDGYVLTDGHTNRTCLATGVWSGNVPRCTRLSCGQLPDIQNSVSTLLNGSAEFGDVALLTCDEGFVSTSDFPSYTTCTSDGLWTKVLMECLRIRCPEILSIENGQVQGSSFRYGDTLNIQCNVGYTLSGSSHLECLSNGSWNSFAYCEKITCSPPELLENGYIRGEGFEYGSIISFVCKDDFELVGPVSRQCNEYGVWSGEIPFCRRITCPTPQYIWNGNVESLSPDYYVGDTAVYVCDKGYVMIGNGTLVCGSSGEWQGTAPQCDIIHCPKPQFVPNGNSVYTEVSYNSKVSYSCDAGFELYGSSVLTCQETGRWDSRAPECRPVNCGRPRYVEHSTVVGDIYTFSNLLTYFCDEGYTLQGEDILVCLEDGQWSSQTPLCIPVSCGPPPEVDNAIWAGINFNYQDTVSYKCSVGYDLFGNDMLECGAGGQWIGSLPSCQPVSCGPPPVFSYATATVLLYTYGSIASYKCNTGYNLRGDPMAKCSADGSWIHDPSTHCEPVDCGVPQAIQHGTIQSLATTYQSVVTYVCDEGYALQSNGPVKCNERGRWVGTLPSCNREACNAPTIDASNRVIISGSNYRVGQSISFSCPEGYIIIGEISSQCLESGSWSSSVPQCLRISCGPLRLPENVSVTQGDVTQDIYFGDMITFTCQEGYIMRGESSIQCLNTGRWSSEAPTCVLESLTSFCLTNIDAPNTLPLIHGYQTGDITTVLCKEGYQATGSMRITCQDDQTWTHPSGICRRVFCGKPRIRDMVNVIRVGGRSYHYGDKVSYRCRPGILPVRFPPEITCQSSGSWDGQIACSLPCKGGCKNGGRCLGLYGCKCPVGYGGKRCEIANCILPCLNGGSCSSPYRCTCPPGYSGSRCQTVTCHRQCQHGGRCRKPNRCQCYNGYKPPFCESKYYVDLLPTDIHITEGPHVRLTREAEIRLATDFLPAVTPPPPPPMTRPPRKRTTQPTITIIPVTTTTIQPTTLETTQPTTSTTETVTTTEAVTTTTEAVTTTTEPPTTTEEEIFFPPPSK